MRPDPHNGSTLVTFSEAARVTLGLFPVQRLLRSPLQAPQGERVWRSARIVRAAASEVAVYSGAFQACARARPRQRESRPVKEQRQRLTPTPIPGREPALVSAAAGAAALARKDEARLRVHQLSLGIARGVLACVRRRAAAGDERREGAYRQRRHDRALDHRRISKRHDGFSEDIQHESCRFHRQPVLDNFTVIRARSSERYSPFRAILLFDPLDRFSALHSDPIILLRPPMVSSMCGVGGSVIELHWHSPHPPARGEGLVYSFETRVPSSSTSIV
jgi:hypothetical protein